MVLATAAHASPEGDTQPTQPTETTKTTKLETTSSKDNAMRRLVEYFVVVSSVPKNKEGEEENNTKLQEASSFEEASRTVALGEDDEEFFVDDFDFQPVITARYPLEDHAKNPLHESVTFFCHPSGAIQLRVEQSMPKVRQSCFVQKEPFSCRSGIFSTQHPLNGSKLGFCLFPKNAFSHQRQRFSFLTMLVERLVDPLFCCDWWQWKEDVRYLPHTVGALRNCWKEKRSAWAGNLKKEGSLSAEVFGNAIVVPVFDGLP